MKIWTSIVTAAAILALAASVGNAATGMIPADQGKNGSRSTQRAVPTGASIKGSAAVIAELKAKNVALTKRLNRLAAKNLALSAARGDMVSEIRALNRRISDLSWELYKALNPLPVGGGGGTPYVDPDEECRDFGSNCTPEQDCRIHGNNCHLVPADDSSTSEASTETVEPEMPLVEELPAEVTGEVQSQGADVVDHSGYDFDGSDWQE